MFDFTNIYHFKKKNSSVIVIVFFILYVIGLNKLQKPREDFLCIKLQDGSVVDDDEENFEYLPSDEPVLFTFRADTTDTPHSITTDERVSSPVIDVLEYHGELPDYPPPRELHDIDAPSTSSCGELPNINAPSTSQENANSGLYNFLL